MSKENANHWTVETINSAPVDLIANQEFVDPIFSFAQQILNIPWKHAHNQDQTIKLAHKYSTFAPQIQLTVVSRPMELESILLKNVQHAKIKALFITSINPVIRFQLSAINPRLALENFALGVNAQQLQNALTTGRHAPTVFAKILAFSWNAATVNMANADIKSLADHANPSQPNQDVKTLIGVVLDSNALMFALKPHAPQIRTATKTEFVKELSRHIDLIPLIV